MSLKDRTIKGLMWSGFSQAGVLVSQFVTTAVLARILKPEDFGLLAMALVISEFVNILCDQGIGNALIQRKDASQEHYSTALWMNVIVSLIWMVAIFFSAPYIAAFYHKPELQPILWVLLLRFPLSAVAIIFQSVLSKQMEFKALAARNFPAVVLSSVLGVILAWCGWGVWSLVWQSIGLAVFNLVGLLMFSRWWPKFIFSMKACRELLGFGLNTTASGFLGGILGNIDKVLIGKYLGASVLGFYSMAYKIMMYPIYHISWITIRVIFPVFSKIQDDLPRCRFAYLRTIKGVALLTTPMVLLLWVCAKEFVYIAYGPGWEPVVGLLRILCFAGLVASVSAVSSQIFLASGKTGLKLKLDTAESILMIAALLICLPWGIYVFAIVFTIFVILWAIVNMLLSGWIVKARVREQLAALKPAVLLSVLAAVVSFWVKSILPSTPWIVLLTSTFCGGIVYIGGLFLLKIVLWENKKIKLNI